LQVAVVRVRVQLFLSLLQRHAGGGGCDLELLLLRTQGRNPGLDPSPIRFRRCAGLLLLCLPRFPGSLGPSCLLGARLTIPLTLFGLALQAFQTLLVTHAGLLGLGVLLLYGADLRLACTEVLHQRNAARTHIGAGTALDAVEQVVA